MLHWSPRWGQKVQTLDPQKHQNHQTKKTLKEKNVLGKSTNKLWKPTKMENIINRTNVIPNKHIQFGGQRT